MADRPVRLLALDIDGTLIDDRGAIPDANRAAVREAVAHGLEVVLVTGRSYHHARPVAERLSPEVALIVSNGALAKRPDGETVHAWPLETDVVRELIVAVRARRPGAALIFDREDRGQYVFEGIDWSHPNRRAYYAKNGQYMTEHSPLEEALTESPIQLAFTGGVQEMRELAAFLRTLPATAHVTLTLTEYEDRDFTLLDITARGCSKGSTLSAWVERAGLAPGHVMAVGDNLNDVEMLSYAGHPVVMGNAVTELLERGWPVTGPHHEAGLAQAIRRILPAGPGD